MNYALKALAILAFGLIFVPFNIAAAGNGWTIFNNSSSVDQTGASDNPVPNISSIFPRVSDVGIGTKTVTITGSGFVPGSIARINATYRFATFIDSEHLLVQINGSDTYAFKTNGGFYITVFNNAPGGGYSNAVFFTINTIVPSTTTNTTNFNSATSTSNTNNYNNTSTSSNTSNTNRDTSANTNQTQNSATNNTSDGSNLASNAIFGSNGFMPSGLIQWILLGIIILVIVILVRKIFGGAESYHESPMKHA